MKQPTRYKSTPYLAALIPFLVREGLPVSLHFKESDATLPVIDLDRDGTPVLRHPDGTHSRLLVPGIARAGTISVIADPADLASASAAYVRSLRVFTTDYTRPREKVFTKGDLVMVKPDSLYQTPLPGVPVCVVAHDPAGIKEYRSRATAPGETHEHIDLLVSVETQGRRVIFPVDSFWFVPFVSADFVPVSSPEKTQQAHDDALNEASRVLS